MLIYVVSFLLTLGVCYFISKPFFTRSEDPSSEPTLFEENFVVERGRLVQSLRELELEKSLGSVPESEYAESRAELSAQLEPYLEKSS